MIAARACARLVGLAVVTVGCGLGAAPAWAGTGDSLTGTEGAPIGSAEQPVEVATESFHTPASVDIDWGDGQHSAGTWGAQGEFSWHIYGYHTYTEEDVFNPLGGGDTPYKTTITVHDTSGGSDVSTGSATVADAPLSAAPIEGATALAGVSTSVALVHFTDGDPGGMTSDYSATINWGDGSAVDNTAQIVASGDGWDVVGTHTYASANTYVAAVTPYDGPFNHAPAQKVNVQVSTNGPVALSANEGTSLSHVLVAQFCNVSGSPAATIDWGDGTAPSAGTVTTVGSCDQVTGSHTYPEESTTPLTTHIALGNQHVDGTARISDAPLSATVNTQALAGTSLGLRSAVLAHASDANDGAPPCGSGGACDLTAQIDWGDGESSPGVVTTNSAGIDVSGPAHTFPGPGTYLVSVTVTDKGGASTVASGQYTVATPPAPRTGCNSAIPKRGDTAGLYGQQLNSATQPNWGISPDDRVLRYGNFVVCAADAPWVYEGVSAALTINGVPPLARDAACPPNGCQALPVAGGVFQTTGRVIVNGIELEGENGKSNTLTIDTSTGSISATFAMGNKATYDVWESEADPVQYPPHGVYLGKVDLTDHPWLPSGDTLAYLPELPAYAATSVAGFTEVGSPRVRIDGLGSSAIDIDTQLPGFFRTDPTRPPGPNNPPPTITTTLSTEYPGEVVSIHPIIGRAGEHGRAQARVAEVSGGCAGSSGPPPGGFEIPVLGIGPLRVGPIDFVYDSSAGEWRGTGCASPLGDALQVGIQFGIKDSTGFDYANGDFKANPGIPIGGVVTLNELGLGIGLHPSRFNGHLVGTVAGILQLDGTYFMVFASPEERYFWTTDQLFAPGTSLLFSDRFFDATAFGGSLGVSFAGALGDLVKVTGGAHALYEAAAPTDNRPHPYAEVGFDVHLNPPDWISWLLTADGNVTGAFGNDTCTTRNEPASCHVGDAAYLIRGQISATIGKIDDVFPGGTVGIDGVVSSYGYAVCTGYIPAVGHIGFGKGINGHPDEIFGPFKGGCDTQDFRPNLAAVPSTAGTAVLVPRGARALELKVTGAGAPPRIAVTGPLGEHDAMPTDNSDIGAAGAIHFFTNRDTHTTYAGIFPVSAGMWHVSALPGSAAISSLYTAFPLPPPRITATITRGPGRTRLLHYHVRPRPGQRVEFVERGRDTAAVIGYAAGATGTLRFSPFGGPAGRRSIYAEITVNNLPDPELLVTRYTAPAPPRPGRPHVRLARRGSRLVVAWRPVADARSYVVAIYGSDRVRTAYLVHAPRVAVPGFGSAGATVRVTGLDVAGRPGPPGMARLATLGAPARVQGLAVHRRGARLVISWHAAARAVRYQVRISFGGARPLMLATLRRTLTLKPRHAKAPVSVSIAGEGADGSVGRGTTVRLARAR